MNLSQAPEAPKQYRTLLVCVWREGGREGWRGGDGGEKSDRPDAVSSRNFRPSRGLYFQFRQLTTTCPELRLAAPPAPST